MQRTKDGVPVFEVEDLGDNEDGWWFEAAMISTCKPIFDHCDANYDVEMELQKENIIRSGECECDSESCALVVNFTDHNLAENFLARLNQYLVKKTSGG